MGRHALATARALGDRALIAAAASAFCLGETVAGRIDHARECREEARAEVDRLTDEELAPRLEALYYLGWAETYLEQYADGIGRFERGLEIARATGDGRLLIPMMLGKNYALEMTGRLGRRARMLRGGARGRAAVRQPARAVPGAVRTRLDALLLGGSRRCDRRLRGEPARRSPSGRRHDPKRGRRSGLGTRRGLVRGRRGRAGTKDPPRARRRRGCAHDAGGALLRLGEPDSWSSLRSETARRPTPMRAAPRRTPRNSGCNSPRRWPVARARRCCSRGVNRPQPRSWRLDPPRPPKRSALSCTRRSRAVSRGGHSRPPVSVRRRSRCCAGPNASSTSAARCASATRRAASCDDWEPELRRVGRPAARRQRARVSDQA